MDCNEKKKKKENGFIQQMTFCAYRAFWIAVLFRGIFDDYAELNLNGFMPRVSLSVCVNVLSIEWHLLMCVCSTPHDYTRM